MMFKAFLLLLVVLVMLAGWISLTQDGAIGVVAVLLIGLPFGARIVWILLSAFARPKEEQIDKGSRPVFEARRQAFSSDVLRNDDSYIPPDAE